MVFYDHSELKGQHAFLSPSNYHWLRYPDQKIQITYENQLVIQRGTDLHALAAECIRLGVRLADNQDTISLYVNDALDYGMSPEVVLYYSPYCFGTADAICFNGEELRIHDLKTGSIKASMDQLLIYAALFCLEYKFEPEEITAHLRIYQNNKSEILVPTADALRSAMLRIVRATTILTEMEARHEH